MLVIQPNNVGKTKQQQQQTEIIDIVEGIFVHLSVCWLFVVAVCITFFVFCFVSVAGIHDINSVTEFCTNSGSKFCTFVVDWALKK